MSKGSQTQTQQTTTGPPPQVQAAYNQLISNTQQLAQTPYVPYTGEGVAPVNAQQYQGIGNINQYAEAAQSPYAQALGLVGGAAQPLSSSQIQQYYNPYQQDVINATQGQFNLQNQQALNNIQGNAAVQGALGGDRSAVGQAAYYGAVLPGQEQAIAGLESQGYNQALATAAGQFQQNPEAAAYGLGNIGAGAQNAALQGAGAQIGAGTLEQQTSQALDQYLYNQYLAQQGYPFALNQYAAGIEGGIGSLSGGTSYGTTTGPPPNQTAQYAGLGLLGLGLFANRGGRVKGYQAGGSPTMPYAGAPSYLPSGLGLPHGPGPPTPGAPRPVNQQPQSGGQSIFGQAQQMAGLGKPAEAGLKNIGSDFSSLFATPDDPTAAAEAASAADWTAGGFDLGAGMQGGGPVNRLPGGLALPGRNRIQMPMRGGMGMPSFVRGYQGGGTPSFADRFGDEMLAIQEAQQAYGAPNRVTTTTIPADQIAGDPIPGDVSTSPAGVYTDISGDMPGRTVAGAEAPAGQRAAGAAPAGLAYAPESAPPGGGVYAPSGVAPPPLPPRMAPSERPSPLPQSGFGLTNFAGVSPDVKYSLMAAGLGALASRSPFLGVALGEGGLQGLQTYSGLKKGEADIEMQARKLDQAAQAEQDRIAHEGATLAETTKYHEQELGLRQRGLEQETWAPFVDISGNTRFFNKKTGEVRDTPPISAPGTTPKSQIPAPTAPPTAPAGPAASPSTPTSAAEPQQKPVQIASQETNGILANSYDAQPASIKTPTHPELQHRDEDFLATLDPNTQALLKGVADYKINPAQLSYRDKTTINRLISRYDPDWSQVRYNTIAKAMPNFTGSGVEARNMTSQDMAMQHIGSALDNIRALDQGNVVGWNAVRNAIKGQYDPTTQVALGKIGTDVQAIQNELTTAFRGSGHPSEQEALQWSKKINYNNPAGLRGALQEAASLLGGRITAAGSRYNDAVGETYARDPMSWMSTKGRAAYNRALSMDPDKGEGPMPQGGQPAAQPSGGGVDPRDAQALRANASNPAAAIAIDKKYGAGTAARLLGTQ